MGNKFYTKRPLVIIKNLPNYGDKLSGDYRKNGWKILAEETNSYLTELGDRFIHRKEFYFSTFRAKYIPVGTRLTVFDEYRHYHYKGFNFGKDDTDIHMLLVKDEHGETGVISELGFKSIVVSEGYGFKPNVYDNQFLDNFETLDREKTLTLYYVPYSNSEQVKIDSLKNIEEFISFFNLENEIVVYSPSRYCEIQLGYKHSELTSSVGTETFINWSDDSCENYFNNLENDLVSGATARITFNSKESFVTTYQFMDSWELSNERMLDRKSQIEWWRNMREEKDENRTIEFY